jgi:aspartate aminotransferase
VADAVTARLFATGAGVPVPAQLAALAATRHADDIGAELCAQLAPARRRLLDALAALPGAPASAVPEGTYYVFADFTRFLAPKLPAAEASAQLVQQLAAAGVEAVDGATCGAPGFVRLSYAVEEAALREAVARLQKLFASRRA